MTNENTTTSEEQNPASKDKGEQKKTRRNSRPTDEITKKWGKAAKETGWTAVPNILLYKQKKIGIDSIDLNIILQLMSYWWQDGNHPFPAKSTIAEAIGIDVSTVRKRIKKMEDTQLIRRIERREKNDRSQTNEYDLSPLVNTIKPFAEEEQEERNRTKKARKARKTSMKTPNSQRNS